MSFRNYFFTTFITSSAVAATITTIFSILIISFTSFFRFESPKPVGSSSGCGVRALHPHPVRS